MSLRKFKVYFKHASHPLGSDILRHYVTSTYNGKDKLKTKCLELAFYIQ